MIPPPPRRTIPITNTKQRDEAFQTYPYPCIGQLRFLDFHLTRMPYADRILTNLRQNPTHNFLDVGCCVGQELRYLANQNISHTQLHGCDTELQFVDLGYRLFRDADSLRASFVHADLLTPDEGEFRRSQLYQSLAGKVDVAYASSFFHLFDWEDQVKAAARLVAVCRDQKGVVVCGRQIGSVRAGSYEMSGRLGTVSKGQYRHDLDSLNRFWKAVGEVTGTRWSVEGELVWTEELEKIRKIPGMDADARLLWWYATRVE